MHIDSVDFFYASMPEVTLEADGSQDALLVRVRAGDAEGWGECESSPLTSIAAFVAPRSHGVCRPVSDSVLGERLDGPDDIRRIARQVARNSMDLLQAPHTFSGIEIALWDLLGRARDEPVWRMLGGRTAHGKLPYASVLFGDTPDETIARGREIVARGFRAVKFGWGPFGHGTAAADADQLHAAREAIGSDHALMVDAGQVWENDVDAASERMGALNDVGALWLEEPFGASEFDAYRTLAARSGSVRLAGGEGAHEEAMARNLLRHADIGYIQIDTGRVGGIGPSARIAEIAQHAGVTYVNHTFTSHLALSASLQAYAAMPDHLICEYPAEPKQLAVDLTTSHLHLDADGLVHPPDAPGLGITVDLEALSPYLRSVVITVDGESLYSSAQPDSSAGSS